MSDPFDPPAPALKTARPTPAPPQTKTDASYTRWAVGGAGWAVAAGIALFASLQISDSHTSVARLESNNQQAQQQAKDLTLKLTNLERQMNSVQEHAQVQAAAADQQSKTLQQHIDMLLHADAFPLIGKAQPLVRGTLFWDKSGNTCTLTAHNVQPPPPGKIYALWIVSAGKTLPAGAALPDATGTLIFNAPLPAGATDIRAAQVTEEPAPAAAPSPTGPIQFLADVSPR